MNTDKPTLHLLMGLPGSGKTTFAKLLQHQTQALRLSSDEYRLMLFVHPTFSQKEHDNLYAILDHNVEHLLQAGHDVIYDANLNRRHHRDEKYALARQHDAHVVLWWLRVPEELAKSRRLNAQDTRLIPAGEDSVRMFERVSKILEVPGSDEPCITVVGTDLNSSKVTELLKQLPY